MSRFLDRLRRGPILLDAAMGTRLEERGLDPESDSTALWNLSHPDAVAATHRQDVVAGADALLTNTFTANRVQLARFGRAAAVEVINRKAVELARSEAGPSRFVIGSIGPPGDPMAPARGSGHEAYRQQAAILTDAGVDAILLETHRARSAVEGLAAVRGATALPVLLSLCAWPSSWDEASLAEQARRFADLGAVALGLNCEAELGVVRLQLERLQRATRLPLLAKPAAGARDEDRPAAL